MVAFKAQSSLALHGFFSHKDTYVLTFICHRPTRTADAVAVICRRAQSGVAEGDAEPAHCSRRSVTTRAFCSRLTTVFFSFCCFLSVTWPPTVSSSITLKGCIVFRGTRELRRALGRRYACCMLSIHVRVAGPSAATLTRMASRYLQGADV